MAVPAAGRFIFKIGEVVWLGLKGFMDCELREIEEERLIVLIAFTDEAHRALGQIISQVIDFITVLIVKDIGILPNVLGSPIKKVRASGIRKSELFETMITRLIPSDSVCSQVPFSEHRTAIAFERFGNRVCIVFIPIKLLPALQRIGKRSRNKALRRIDLIRILRITFSLVENVVTCWWRPIDIIVTPIRIRGSRQKSKPGGILPRQQGRSGRRTERSRIGLCEGHPICGELIDTRGFIIALRRIYVHHARRIAHDIHPAQIVRKNDNHIWLFSRVYGYRAP